MKKIVPVIIAGALLVSGVAYAGYRYVQEKKAANGFQNGQWMNQEGFGQNRVGARRSAGGMVAGEIAAKENDNLTLKLPEGGSKIIFYSDLTKVSSYADIAVADLVVGDQVTVMATMGGGGEITAQSVQAGASDGDAMPGRAGGQNAGIGGQKNKNDAGGRAGNMDFTFGQITVIGGKTITVKSSDGSVKSIALAETAKYSRISESSADDLAAGKIVMIAGTSNTDGSVTAKSIQIRPELPAIPKQNQLQNAPQKNATPDQNNQGGGMRTHFDD